MIVKETFIPGCFELRPIILKDSRGRFVKTFDENLFAEKGLETNYKEEYYSVSKRGVLRGLHFQLPPKDLAKLVYCVSGEVFDVVVDLRVNSPTYGSFKSFILNADQGCMVYIPRGLAHGFYTISQEAVMLYRVTALYSPEHDAGILWNSVNIPWPDDNPMTSERDNEFVPLSEFSSPFLFKGDHQ